MIDGGYRGRQQEGGGRKAGAQITFILPRGGLPRKFVWLYRDEQVSGKKGNSFFKCQYIPQVGCGTHRGKD